MAKINPSLNLNKTPNLVESNTLVCAKNIRLLKDGSIGVDTPFGKIDILDKILAAKNEIAADKSNLQEDLITKQQQYGNIKAKIDNLSLPNTIYNYVKTIDVSETEVYGNVGHFGEAIYNTNFFGNNERAINGDAITDPIIISNYATLSKQQVGQETYPIVTFNDADNPDAPYIASINNELRVPYNIKDYVNAIAESYSYYEDYEMVKYFRAVAEEYDNAVSELENIEDFDNYFYKLPDISTIGGKYKVEMFAMGHAIGFVVDRTMQALADKIIDYNINDDNEFRSLNRQLKDKDKEIKEINKKINEDTEILNRIKDYNENNIVYNLLGNISSNDNVYLFYEIKEIKETPEQEDKYYYIIVNYDENSNSVEICNCNWSSGSKNISNTTIKTTITGTCTKNINDENVIIVAEYVNDDVLIPIKNINLSLSSSLDNESIYTQNPIVNIVNIKLGGYYPAKIRAGVYQFFIRYKIREYYSSWMVASNPMFAGKLCNESTSQGTIRYVDEDVDASESFILNIENVYNLNDLYTEFQIGFIVNNPKDGILYRSWKHFNIDTKSINFDYLTEDVKEISQKDLLNVTYGIYNVKNVDLFKNKLYISNYVEHNFNPKEVVDFANNTNVRLKVKANVFWPYLDDYDVSKSTYELYDLNEFVTEDGDKYNYFKSMSASDDTEYTVINILERDYNLSYGRKHTFTKLGLTITLADRVGTDDEQNIFVQDKFVLKTVEKNIDTNKETYNITYYDTYRNLLNYIKNNYDIIFFSESEGFIGKTLNNKRIKLIKFSIYDYNDNFRIFDILINFDYNKVVIPVVNKNERFTLIPYQSYDFYVHLIKNTGEYTNGVKIGSISLDAPEKYDNLTDCFFYPSFIFNSPLPAGYVSCFITIRHTKTKVSEIFNENSLELDLGIYPESENLIIKQFVNNEYITFNGHYYSSADPKGGILFGASGKIGVSDSSGRQNGKSFIVYDYNAEEINVKLTKITPYINPVITDEQETYIYDDYNSLYLPGYICTVSKPEFYEKKYYFSGTDVYGKQLDGNKLNLVDLSFNDTKTALELKSSQSYDIYSNFNLNYISLFEDNSYIYKQKTILIGDSKDTKLVRIKNSFELNNVYFLNNCYRDIDFITYSEWDDYAQYKFNNTIRSSNTISDEEKISIFKFDATDYYNVPTNKGIIVNLKAAGIHIFVHTEDGLFRFSGNNTISNNGGEDIALKEQESVFDTGVQEIFGSDHGFGGINKKSHAILTNDSYTFYDEDSNNLYTLKDNSQIKAISDNIRKLLDYDTITDLKFANDFYNDILFIYITYSNGKYVTLSYNTKVENFVSIHDFIFDYAFNTKTRCYFIKNDEIFYKTKTFNNSLINNNRYLVDVDNNIYPCYKETSVVSESEINIGSRPYFDVILTDNYESIKTLNYINWMCNEIEGFIHSVPTNYDNETEQDIIDDCVAEESKSKYAGNYIRIYTNVSATKLIDLTEDDDTTGRRSINFYNNMTKPYYDLGRWNFNYFRNALNVKENNADNKSLIYGNYIVVRFIFSNKINFKFDSINFNINNNYETSFK